VSSLRGFPNRLYPPTRFLHTTRAHNPFFAFQIRRVHVWMAESRSISLPSIFSHAPPQAGHNKNSNDSRCSSSIDIVANHVVLSPFQCCVSQSQTEKGAGKVDCPSCGTPVSSHHFYKGRLPHRKIVRHSESTAP
jgi:hypothetical protein